MSQQTITTCDLCGWKGIPGKFKTLTLDTLSRYDACPDCVDAFRKWVASRQGEPDARVQVRKSKLGRNETDK